MSKAIKGDGEVRRQMREGMETVSAAVGRLTADVLVDEVGVRRNLDRETAEWLIQVVNESMGHLQKLHGVFEAARKHHAGQTSVKKNSHFGQARRIHAGRKVVIEKLDPTRFAAQAEKDGFSSMTPQEQAAYVVRGQDPVDEFFTWDKARKLDYLAGRFTP